MTDVLAMTGDAEALRPTARPGRKRKRIVTQSPDQPQKQTAKPAAVRAPRPKGVPQGWRVIAAKEFADQVTSVRFLILTLVLALAGAAAAYSFANALKTIVQNPDLIGQPSLFLLLFTRTVPDSNIPSFVDFVTFLGPLLGIAFGFDGINGERSEGTLPRLLSQPIHRDDVINGKFVAGLGTIMAILIAVVGIVAAVGILQLGVLPSVEDVIRIGVWLILAGAYIGLWLGFALLCSVLLRRAATSALTALAAWFGLTVFAGLLVTALAGFIAPIGPDSTATEEANNLRWQVNLSRLLPQQLFDEATSVMLDASKRTSAPGLITFDQAEGAVAGQLAIDQSILVVWPQFVALIALTAGSFAVAYVAFMRQEVRA